MPATPNIAVETALDALGNAVRRDIVRLLATGPHTVGDIAETFPISRPAISKHLRILDNAGIIAHDPDGTRNVYRLDHPGFAVARGWLDQFWDDALNRLKFTAENTLQIIHK